jgi:HK97 family phage major capsid protein
MSALARLDSTEFHRRAVAGERPNAALNIEFKLAAPSDTASDSRSVDFVFSTQRTDSYNDRITVKGWEWDKSGAGTPAFFGHDPSKVENIIGRAHNIRIEGDALVGSIEFAPADVNPTADAVYRMVKGGFLNSVSVGFQPIEWVPANDPTRPGGLNFKRQKLLEISVVGLPANEDAIKLARAAGIRVDLIKKELEMPRSTLAERRAKATAVQAANDNGKRFGSLAEMMRSAFLQERDSIPDHRLVRAPAGASEGDPAGGGFIVPEVYAAQMISTMYDTESSLASLCTRLPTDNPLASIKFPGIDETSRADGSRAGGIVSRWVSEGDAAVLSFPRFKNLEFVPKKLLGATVVTDELLADGALFDTTIRRAFAMEFGYRLDAAVFNGTGAGQPLGFLGAPATIVVAKETGQAAGTIVKENIDKMWSRMVAPSRRRAVWLVAEGVEPQLAALNAAVTGDGLQYADDGVGGQVPVLKGRPVIAIEQAPALGTLGDITLIDPTKYLIVDGGTKPALSVHFRFDSDQSIFRFVLRADGRPEYASPVTSVDGVTRSAFVALAAR